jgi:CheY-like chemotaxis protein
MATILIVNNHPTDIETLKTVLCDASYILVFAESGNQAIAVTRSLHVDLILLDMSMPDMNGIEIYTRLQASNQTACIPTILLSDEQDGDVLRGLQLGIEDYVIKPLLAQEIGSRVRIHLVLGAKDCRSRETATRKFAMSRCADVASENALERIQYDLKDPLSVIKLSSYIISTLVADADDRVECQTQRIMAAIDEISRVIETNLQVRKTANDNVLNITTIEIIPFIESILELHQKLALFNGIHLYSDLWKLNPLEIAYFDAEQITNVLNRVIETAIKCAAPEGNVSVTANLESNVLWISVSATGCNFLEILNRKNVLLYQDLCHDSRIEMIWRLSIAETIVEMNGGKILVQGEAEQDNTFSILLPQ